MITAQLYEPQVPTLNQGKGVLLTQRLAVDTMANFLGFLKSVTLWRKGNWPKLRGTAVPPRLALLTQGASQAPVLVRVQILQKEEIQ